MKNGNSLGGTLFGRSAQFAPRLCWPLNSNFSFHIFVFLFSPTWRLMRSIFLSERVLLKNEPFLTTAGTWSSFSFPWQKELRTYNRTVDAFSLKGIITSQARSHLPSLTFKDEDAKYYIEDDDLSFKVLRFITYSTLNFKHNNTSSFPSPR